MCFDAITCYIITAATYCDKICNDCKIAIVSYNIIIYNITLWIYRSYNNISFFINSQKQ